MIYISVHETISREYERMILCDLVTGEVCDTKLLILLMCGCLIDIDHTCKKKCRGRRQ